MGQEKAKVQSDEKQDTECLGHPKLTGECQTFRTGTFPTRPGTGPEDPLSGPESAPAPRA